MLQHVSRALVARRFPHILNSARHSPFRSGHSRSTSTPRAKMSTKNSEQGGSLCAAVVCVVAGPPLTSSACSR
jgi:hypothetical protein